jgi:hypothetical protein
MVQVGTIGTKVNKDKFYLQTTRLTVPYLYSRGPGFERAGRAQSV